MHSLLDIDIPLIRRRLTNLQGIDQIEIFDDRATDATFVTIIVTLSNLAEAILAALQKTLLHLPKVTPFIVDEHGKETHIGSISAEEFKKYTKKKSIKGNKR